MRLGWCGCLQDVGLLAGAGYDFVELPVREALAPDRSDENFEVIVDELRKSGIGTDAFCMLTPDDKRLVGPGANAEQLLSWVEAACRRAAGLGAKVIVFQAGAARSIPFGWDEEVGMGELATFLHDAQKLASSHRLRIAVQPLCSSETNVINTIEEALRFLSGIQDSQLGISANLYQMAREEDPLESLLKARERLIHVHLSVPADHGVPKALPPDVREFLSTLRDMGYDGPVAVECICTDVATEAPAALEALRAAWS